MRFGPSATPGQERPAEHEGEWGYGDVWTWVALDPDTKLVCNVAGWASATAGRPSFIARPRRSASQPGPDHHDGHRPYIEAIEAAFGKEVDYAMLVKEYGVDPNEERRSARRSCCHETVRVIQGDPDPSGSAPATSSART